MFERMRPGYYVLIALALIEFSLAFVIGKADIWNYLKTSGLKQMLVPMGALFPLLWAGAVTFAITRRQVPRPLAAIRKMIPGPTLAGSRHGDSVIFCPKVCPQRLHGCDSGHGLWRSRPLLWLC